MLYVRADSREKNHPAANAQKRTGSTDETKLSAAEGDFTETGFRLSFLIINENKKHIIKDGNRCAASSAKPNALDEYIPAPTAETAKAGPEFTQ